MNRLMAVSIIALVVLGSASAEVTTYFGQDLVGSGTTDPVSSWPNALTASNSFQSMLVGVGTETFEGFADGTAMNGQTLNFGAAGTATFSGSMAIQSGYSTGRFAISGSKYVEGSTGSFGITFSEEIAAFGFYGTDIGDFTGQVTVTTANGVSHIYTIPHHIGNGSNSDPGDGSALFWGIIDTTNPFTSVSISNSASGTDYFGFDDMTIGGIENVVPLPGAVLLGVLGLSVAGARLRRRS